MSSKKRRKKRRSREAKRSGATLKKREISAPVERLTSKASQPAKSGHAKEISKLISKGKVKNAVNMAKQYHKNLSTKESEAILVEAYIARILEMTEKGLTVEAKTLLDLVRERYCLPDQRLAEIDAATAAREGINDAFLAPLNDPSMPTEQRAAIQKIIKRDLVDLNILTACKTLSPDHPLKVEAAAVSKAFEAVTTGPVDDKEIALPSISRKSPLAPWKMLIKALFCFYRRDDALCERYLQAVEIDSAPARLVPAIRAMVSGKTGAHLSENTRSLVEQVGGNRTEVRKKFQDLERALTAGKSKGLLRAISDAVAISEDFCPELVDRLKQHISIRSWMIEAEEKSVKRAMGGPSLKNACFWRLFARAAEIKGKGFLACAMWDEFMKHAVHEGIFSTNSTECSVVYLHMANLLLDMADTDFEWARSQFENTFKRSKGLSSYYKEQPKFISDAVRKNKNVGLHADFLYPERLYRLACEIDPTSEAFANWLEWIGKGNFHQKKSTDVALAWHKAIPNDVRPLLYLAKSAEKKNAFKKCLAYLDEAEQIDGLNPEVKKIRLRVLVATAIRHLKQKKAHLAKKDLKEMEALPLFKAGDRPAFLTALRSVCAMIEGDKGELRRLNNELIKLMGSQLSAAMILQELLKTCGLPEDASTLSLTTKNGLKDDDLLFAVARGCLLGDDVGVPITIPAVYKREIEEAFATNVPALNASMMGAIAEAALRGNHPELAYAVSGAGLLKDNAASAGFLLLRARSLPSWEGLRKNYCIDAAIALASRERDMDLIDEAIELRRNGKELWYISPFWERRMEGKDFSTDPEGINDVLTREREAREYPTRAFGSLFEDFDDDNEYDDYGSDQCRHCDVKDCLDRTAEYVPDDDDDEWEDGDTELLEAMFDDGFPNLPSDIPPEAVSVIMEMVLKYRGKNGQLPDLDELLEKEPELAEKILDAVFDAGDGGYLPNFGPDRLPGSGRGSKKKRRKKKGQR
ncbi:MAG: hypothetical protein JRJ21_01255 [Deltaproteobacteria bacterium]|nr:hypothetical protein [Deltaproteobacteria bacterium]